MRVHLNEEQEEELFQNFESQMQFFDDSVLKFVIDANLHIGLFVAIFSLFQCYFYPVFS